MQSAFITDLRANAVPVANARGTDAAVSIRYFDHAGRQVGNSVATAKEFADQARAMLAFAEAAILYAAGADNAAKPPHHHFPVMRDLRIADAPKPAATISDRQAQ